MTSSDKIPPLLSKATLYTDWKKKVRIWSTFSRLEKNKHGAAVLMTLEGAAEETVLELEESAINSENGLVEVIKKLDSLYLKDSTLEKFQTLEIFDSYKRKPNVSIQGHIHEFEKIYHKLQSHGTTISEDVLAFKLLKSANLSPQDEKLAKGTVSELTLQIMKDQLKKIFNDAASFSSHSTDSLAAGSLAVHDINEVSTDESFEDTFFTGRRNQFPVRRPQTQYSYGNQSRPTYNQSANSFRSTNRYFSPSARSRQAQQYPQRSRNPIDSRTGEISRCAICDSTLHWANSCPENQFERQRPFRSTQNQSNTRYTYFTDDHQSSQNLETATGHDSQFDIVLFQSDYDHPKNLPALVAESWNAAVLDSGATKTVCGRSWFNTYVESLSPEDQTKVNTSPTKHLYRFGDQNTALASTTANIPAVLAHNKVLISTDIVDRDIPLLLSKEAMKRANMTIDFRSDTANVLNSTVDLNVTKSGHYTIPLTAPTQLLSTLTSKPGISIALTITDSPSKKKQALKIHRQFAHAPLEKLLKLISSAGEPWSTDKELRDELTAVTKSCKTCEVYRPASNRPCVGMPMANHFLQTVAMDLKFYHDKILLHMIDHATRLSSSVHIPSKKPENILQGIFSHWIGIYGSAGKFLTDNGGEFVNDQFLELCEAFNICVKTTGAESPWSNGLVE